MLPSEAHLSYSSLLVWLGCQKASPSEVTPFYGRRLCPLWCRLLFLAQRRHNHATRAQCSVRMTEMSAAVIKQTVQPLSIIDRARKHTGTLKQILDLLPSSKMLFYHVLNSQNLQDQELQRPITCEVWHISGLLNSVMYDKSIGLLWLLSCNTCTSFSPKWPPVPHTSSFGLWRCVHTQSTGLNEQ